MNTKVIYPLSADPITFGHINIVERALNVFDKIIVAIGNNSKKKYTFDLIERTEMAKNAFNHLKERISVVSFEGLLIDFAASQDVHVILRGIRNSVIDYDFESLLNQVNYNLDKNIETYILFSDPKLSHISSSVVKELTQAGSLDIHKYVPFYVKKNLEDTLLKQRRIGITGEIGAGKSFVTETFMKYFKKMEIQCHNIDLDSIGKHILTEDTSPLSIRTRKSVSDLLNLGSGSDPVDIRKMNIWGNPDLLKKFNEIMTQPFLVAIASRLRNLEGFVFINSALLIDQDISFICNNEVILVHADENERRSRLKHRGYSEKEIKNRMNSQYSSEFKKELLTKRIEESHHGWILEFDNTKTTTCDIELFIKKEFTRGI